MGIDYEPETPLIGGEEYLCPVCVVPERSQLSKERFEEIPLIRKAHEATGIVRLTFQIGAEQSAFHSTVPFVVEVALQPEDDDRRNYRMPFVPRLYAPVTPPWVSGEMEVVVKRYEGGMVSPRLQDLKAGQGVPMRGPFVYEDTTVDPRAWSHVIAVSAGVAAVTALQIGMGVVTGSDSCHLTLFLAFNSEDEEVCSEDFRLLKRLAPRRVAVNKHFSLRKNQTKHPDGQAVRKSLGGKRVGESTLALIAGPHEFANTMKSDGALEEAGVPPDNVVVLKRDPQQMGLLHATQREGGRER